MAFVPHLLLSFGGPLFDSEQWSCNIRMYSSVYEGLSPSARLDYALAEVEDMHNDCSLYVSNPAGVFHTRARHAWTKFNPINSAGDYESPSTTVRFDTVGALPAGPKTPGVPQLAIAVSHLTARQRGPASRGRHYVPTGPGTVDSTTGRMSSTIANEAVNAAATFFTNLNNAAGIDLPGGPVVNVISNVGQPGPHEQVTQVAVGNVYDTQRRRRNEMPEIYVDADVEGLNP